MYLPFLRSKQFELLALRDLIHLPLESQKISPIIEPVKKDIKGIETAIGSLYKNKINLQLIVNPENGDIKKDNKIIFDLIDKLKSNGIGNITPTYIISKDTDFINFKKSIKTYGHENTGYSIIRLNPTSNSEELKNIVNSTNIIYNIIQVNHIFSLRRGYPSDKLAFLNDPFIKQKKNGDYKDFEDEFFSNDYLHYKSEGFYGFSDYLTIGAEFIEGGMLPYAVVIHLTYVDKNTKDIRIKHFLSDSNYDTSDTGGKFYEALEKLIHFVNTEHIYNTIAIQQFKEYYTKGTFPGLGVIKKLSIMHHIELIQSLL
ncbi:hypothetical protein BWI96_08925 [Siphonobacter sp. SORGH_AS_0500]|uniref:sce7725 family protein n=1 Tax=Siphonobacter sp. SORGH_AS_0500 TaxID=1864824 RepID=UPI000CC92E22|nr:sce7725 family protein [Siphonobacter sp. SORGH_AS_0500]PKK36993.1 hypothetical protein BWI96_08925 [Siphonobacter sp. SORGH_AS_0500]